MSEFATCIKDAAGALKDITDEDVANITRSAKAGLALSELNSSIPRQDGWIQDIIGEKDLADFGKSIVAFADCLIKYSEKVSGEAIDSAAIQTSADAGRALSDLNGAIPAQGGWAQTIMGSQDLATFGASIVMFAHYLVRYSDKIKESELDPAAITKSAEAGKALADLNGAIPAQGGWAQTIMGSQDLATFGASLLTFGQGLVDYSNCAVQIDDTKIAGIKKSGEAMDALKAVVEKIPTTGGWGDVIFGSSDGQSFGAGLTSLATGISDYCDTAASIDDTDIKAIKGSKDAITELKNVLDEIPEKSETDKASTLRYAVDNLRNVAAGINLITTAEYDYTGLPKLGTAVRVLVSIVMGVDAESIRTKYGQLKTAIGDAKTIADYMASLNEHTYGGITKFKKALTSLAGADVDGVIENFSGKAADARSSMNSLVNAMANGISEKVGKVTDAMSELMNAVLRNIRGSYDNFRTVGTTLAGCLASGFLKKKDDASDASATVAGKMISGVRSKYDDMRNAGGYLGAGLVNGIKLKEYAVYRAGFALGQAAVQGEKDGQQSESPSKATIQAGKWLGEGLVIGIDRMTNSVYNAGRSMGASAVGSISKSISRISDLVESGIDSQPTIRPVLDLSDVQAGVGAIGGMLNMGSSIGVMANVGAISSMMNSRNQNGANAEVVSAINRLSKQLDSVGNTTYQVNGVTYDDGSNISDAVKTLVRAARIERRV